MRSGKASLALLLFAVAILSLAVGWKSPSEFSESAQARPDRLARQLRRFRTETDPERRVEEIRRFGPVQDPRVVLALMEVVLDEMAKYYSAGGDPPQLLLFASSELVEHHIPQDEWVPAKYWAVAARWWVKHEDETRKNAAALPR
jgi:hypothetical protein